MSEHDNAEIVVRATLRRTLGLTRDSICELLINRGIYGLTAHQCQALVEPPINADDARRALDALVESGAVVTLKLPDWPILYFHKSHAGRMETRRKTMGRAAMLAERPHALTQAEYIRIVV
jgi:Fe2+ or Zn2+ uptake regulation protein